MQIIPLALSAVGAALVVPGVYSMALGISEWASDVYKLADELQWEAGGGPRPAAAFSQLSVAAGGRTLLAGRWEAAKQLLRPREIAATCL